MHRNTPGRMGSARAHLLAAALAVSAASAGVAEDQAWTLPEGTKTLNGDFAAGASVEEAGWRSWSRDDLLEVDFASETRRGERSVRVVYPDLEARYYFDWWLASEGRQAVEPGEQWTASAWVKYENTGRLAVEIMALRDGEELGRWRSGYAIAYGSGDWELLQATATIPPECDEIYVRFSGSGRTEAWIDDVRLWEGEPRRSAASSPKIEGWAYETNGVQHELGRAVVATVREGGDVYLRWRLLEQDSAEVGFNVYRSAADGEPRQINDEPITHTTDFIDATADTSVDNAYSVRPVVDGIELNASDPFTLPADTPARPYVAIELKDEDTTFQKVGVGDLNGDGRLDYVIKTPNTNVDPWQGHWRPSEQTYALQAYLSDGTFLWQKDLGWNIEAGIWYSPFIVYDFNGDGRAEVAVKTAPTDRDFRETDPCEHGFYEAGRVMSGPEYVSILDGMTGEETARADWPSRDGLGSYNHISRNQIGVAYLDGKTPCLLLQRGTYTVLKLEAWQFTPDGELEPLWTWGSTDEPGGLYYGQGAHNLLTTDLDGDGRDEIVLGACAIDDNGEGLWSLGIGHPDNLYVGDIDPSRPGLEVYYGQEGGRVKGALHHGIGLLDGASGELLWGLDQSTAHIHSAGLVSNIDARHRGMECYSGEQGSDERWLHTARGKLLAREDELPWATLAPGAVYWDETTQREVVVDGRIFRFPEDETVTDGIEGRRVASLDLFGDWREEIVTSVPGELRIYTTPISARDRRVTLLQDRLYRTSVAHMAMGYGNNPPLTSYFIEAER